MDLANNKLIENSELVLTKTSNDSQDKCSSNSSKILTYRPPLQAVAKECYTAEILSVLLTLLSNL